MSKKYYSKKYFVQGMHCQACELLVKNKLEDSPDIESANARLSNKTVTITQKRGSKKGVNFYNKLLNDTGYSLSSQPIGAVKWDFNSVIVSIFTILLLAVVFLFIRSKGFMAYASVTENSALPAFFVFGVVAGLSSCAALVGGLLLTLSKQWSNLYSNNNAFSKKATPFIIFNAGRLISYALLGGLLGLIGSALQPNISTTATLTLLVSILMLIIALQMLGIPWVSKIRLQLPIKITKNLSAANNFQGKYMPFLAGAGTFFLPCGFTLLTQTIALTTGNFITSGAIMFLFALGTLPPLIVISFSSIKFQTNPSFAGTFNLVVGLIILFFGIYNINSQLVVLGLPNASTILDRPQVAGGVTINGFDEEGLGSEIVNVKEGQHQNVHLKASGFEYFPRTLTLASGVPTTMTIDSENVIGCAQAMSLRGLHNSVVYLNKPSQEITFTPQAGTYYISCTMGMVQPIIVTVI